MSNDFDWLEGVDYPRFEPEVGMRVMNIRMNDSDPVDEGMMGTITTIDSLGTIHVRWDDGRRLGLIPGEDEYTILGHIVEDSNPKPVLRNSNSTPAGKSLNKNFKAGLRKGGVKDIKVETEKIKGGKADKLTPEDLAKKHSVSVDSIKKEIQVGIKIEMEHTDSKEMAKEIVMDHLSEFPDYYSNKKYGLKASEKGLEKDLEETTMAGSAGAYSAPLFGEKKKNESKTIKVGDLVNEVVTTYNKDFENQDNTAWADKNKDGWKWNDTPIFTGGEIVDLITKMKSTWDDKNMDVSKEWEKIQNQEISKKETKLKKQIKEGKTKKNKKEEKDDIEETTTFSSVWGVNGPPVGPIAFARKGDHKPSKKPIWKGGQIIQKVSKSDILNEINDIKFVKGGKFVKIKDKCSKYNNNEHCSQGAIDDPLELSDTTFENIKEVSRLTGISEQDIIKRILESNKQLPTQKMKYWFNFSYNKPSETMDELELDEFYSKMKQEFIDDFESELSGLTYTEKCDLFDDLAY
jgi:hypothetical protein